MREELISKIENAFRDVPYPGDNNIGMSDTDDFIGQTEWEKVPLEILLRKQTEILVLTPAAYHFYLPAFLVAMLQYPEADQLLESTIFSLAPSPAAYTARQIAEYGIPLFSSIQRSVIVAFIEEVGELFPQSSYNILPEASAQLQSALQFWKGN